MSVSSSMTCACVALAACHAPASPEPSPGRPCCAVLELRQYTLHPGQRDVLIELFDRAFVETQEAEGMAILGQFRDLDRPDRFVWLRGFDDMPGRARSLAAFYGGPTWKAHSREANATMVDASNVLLLRPARPASGFSLHGQRRCPAETACPPSTRVVIATLYYFDGAPSEDLVSALDRDITSLWTAAGATLLARFVTETSRNTFPALPVREGEHVLVVFSSFADPDAYVRFADALQRSARWRDRVNVAARPPETLRLSPTMRSLL